MHGQTDRTETGRETETDRDRLRQTDRQKKGERGTERVNKSVSDLI